MRPLPVLFVVLLLVVPLAVPAAADGAGPQMQTDETEDLPQITVIENTTNHLSIPDSDVRQSSYNQSEIDVGVAVETGSQKMRNQHAGQTFNERFFTLESDAARDQLVDQKLTDIEGRETQLSNRNERAMEQYANGALTTREFLRQRALIDAESRYLTQQIERIRQAEQTAPGYSLSDEREFRLEDTRGVLKTYRGPISEQISAETAGSASPQRVYLEASTNGYMLATVGENEYVRETYLGGEREPTMVDQFAESEDRLRAANARAENLYPWLYGEQLPGVQTYGRTGIYQIQADHQHGQLTAYLDGGTTNVFFETQRLELSSVSTTETDPVVNESIGVRVSRSYESGPLLILVSNNQTGAPVESTVSINGQTVGTTENNGALWTVEPRDDYTVTVRTADGVNVTVPVTTDT